MVSGSVRSLQAVIGAQVLQEEVLLTLFIEVEGILNAKPLGCISSDVADPDPVMPSMMGRQNASLPQVAYAPDALTRRCWVHCQMMAATSGHSSSETTYPLFKPARGDTNM